ncbi:hypothetical protein OM076_31070 [Solirubrobacter ginsenosidimutans]|uniref:Glycosyltransferase RgtA/B/C/D-like domain-containing protein n=1 Tax=Solirubrobacter ginsenosidimutans TaxID=490573 RepID=A0A9X3MXB1_9ACTN|nr:hypothetical protein [Solirubrobacter ginsenosidimutans]MDA0164751.1 hypothetical protein [Solirubrobacter ginsenosidimutans]
MAGTILSAGQGTRDVPVTAPARSRTALRLTAAYLALVALYVAYSWTRATPFGFVDELVYGKLAQNLAHGQGLSYEGLSVTAYKTIYPFVIAPAWALFSDPDRAYHAALVINALLMPAVMFPAYAIARRVATPGWALVAAIAAAVAPAMAWSSLLMTEALAYPLAGLALFATVRTIARPGPATGIQALLACVAAATARSQLLALLVVLALAVMLDIARHGGDARARLREHRVLVALLGAGVAVALVLILGGYRESLIGNYSADVGRGSPLGDVLTYLPRYVTVLAVSSLLMPLIALGALATKRDAWRDPALGPVLVVATTAAVTFLLVGAWASATISPELRERYVFYPVPVLVALWVALPGRASARRVLVVAAILTAWLLPVFPGLYGDASAEWVGYTLNSLVQSLPVNLIWPAWLPGADFKLWAVAAAVMGVLTWWALLGGKRISTPLKALAFCIPVVAFGVGVVTARQHDLGAQASVQLALRPRPPDWIDRHVDGPAAFIATTEDSLRDQWHFELWNQRLDRAWRLSSVPAVSSIGQRCELDVGPDGTLTPSAAQQRVAADPAKPCAGAALPRYLVFWDRVHRISIPNAKLIYRDDAATLWKVPEGVVPRLKLLPAPR